jgi:hypothetical protein
MADQIHPAQRQYDAEGADEQWQQGRDDGAEHQQQQDDDNWDGEFLGALQVLLTGGLQVAIHRRRPGQVVLEGDVLDARAQIRNQLLDVALVAFERDERERRVAVGADQQRVVAE